MNVQVGLCVNKAVYTHHEEVCRVPYKTMNVRQMFDAVNTCRAVAQSSALGYGT